MNRPALDRMVLLRVFAIALLAVAPDDPSARDEFVGALRNLQPDPPAKLLEERASELAAGSGATAAWLEIREADALPVAADGSPTSLSAVQRELLARTAPRLPRAEVLRTLTKQATANPTAAWRGAALELLRWHASATEVPLLVELVSGARGEVPSDGPLVEGFQVTLVEIVRRDAGIYGQLDWLLAHAPPLRPTVVHALGIAGDPEALPHLAEMLEDREITGVVLQEIARLGPRAPRDARAGLADRVRPFLAASDRAARGHAIRGLVALRDEKAVQLLIEIVESPDARGQGTVFASLRELTGKNLPDQAERWRRWYAEERRWLEADAAAALEKVSSEKEADVVAAIREISGHGLERDRLAEAIARVLREHSSAVVRGQACIGLERLGSRVGLEALVQSLADPDPSVGGQALQALRSITRLSLPWDAKAWLKALRSEA